MILYKGNFFDFEDFSINFIAINFKNYKDTECLCYIKDTINELKKFKKFYPPGSNERIFLFHSVCIAHQLYKKWHAEILQKKGLLL